MRFLIKHRVTIYSRLIDIVTRSSRITGSWDNTLTSHPRVISFACADTQTVASRPRLRLPVSLIKKHPTITA